MEQIFSFSEPLPVTGDRRDLDHGVVRSTELLEALDTEGVDQPGVERRFPAATGAPHVPEVLWRHHTRWGERGGRRRRRPVVNQSRIGELAEHPCHAPDHLLGKVVGSFRDVVSHVSTQVISQAYHSWCCSLPFLFINTTRTNELRIDFKSSCQKKEFVWNLTEST